jgi:hypothetical protein
MIQLNLLPDVKLEYIKAQRSRRLVLSLSVLASAISIGLLLLLLGANGLQKKHIKDLSNDIAKQSRVLQQQPQIDRILTVQNQLESLTTLHAAKPDASRLFSYLNSVTPAQVSITDFKIDFNLKTATITGKADALSSVNKYIDTLKFTTYKSGQTTGTPNAFSKIVMSSFGLSTGDNTGKPATYSIAMAYDKNIFDVAQDVKLSVPNLTTTRSTLDNQSDLFEALPSKQGAQ